MATSGTYAWSPTNASIIEEAAERAGIDPATLTHRHLTSAKSSLNYVLLELQSEQPDIFWRVDRESTSLSAAASSLALASGTVEVNDVMILPAGETSYRPLTRVNRQDFLMLATPTSTANAPSQYYVNHDTLNSPVMVFWPIPTVAITVVYDRLRMAEDTLALSDSPDAHRLWWDALAYGLALRLAEKFKDDKVAYLNARFDMAKRLAKMSIKTGAEVIVIGRGFGRSRRGRS
jgi:hypothetical protein